MPNTSPFTVSTLKQLSNIRPITTPQPTQIRYEKGGNNNSTRIIQQRPLSRVKPKGNLVFSY